MTVSADKHERVKFNFKCFKFCSITNSVTLISKVFDSIQLITGFIKKLSYLAFLVTSKLSDI